MIYRLSFSIVQFETVPRRERNSRYRSRLRGTRKQTYRQTDRDT